MMASTTLRLTHVVRKIAFQHISSIFVSFLVLFALFPLFPSAIGEGKDFDQSDFDVPSLYMCLALQTVGLVIQEKG